MDSFKRKIICIGLDGATFDLIKPWIKEGKLPTFEELLKKGVHGNLKSTIPFATIPAWPSFATGCNPGKHGFFDFFIEKKNSYELTVEMNPSKAIKMPTIWDILSNNGMKVGVINVPSTYPPKEVNGYIVTGLFTPPGANYTYPPEFQQEIKKIIGKYDIFSSSMSSKNPNSLIMDLTESLNQRINIFLYLLNKKDLDFLMMVDNGTDRAEHELWKFLDPSNPLYNSEEKNRFGNPLLKYYQIVDMVLSKIINHLDKDTILIIMSDHGQGSLKKVLNLNLFLIENGYMKIKQDIYSKLRYFLFKYGYSPRNLYKLLKVLGFERFASGRFGQNLRLSLLNKFFFSYFDIDWQNTRLFASGVSGGICVNLKGRQAQGIVKPGKDYENIREEIMKKLSQWKDPETGKCVIKKNFRREEIYHGIFLEKAPDTIAVPRNNYSFFNMYGFSSHKSIENTFGNSGNHTPNGIFIAKGIDIISGKEIKNVEIIDLAPTILHIMDIPIPDHMDGKVLRAIFIKDSEILKRKVKYQKRSEKLALNEHITKLRLRKKFSS